MRYTDPRGEWFGLDDLAALIVGAVIGAVSNVVSDLVKGDFNVGDLIGDSILGAVSGAVDVELQHNGIPVYISMNTRGMSAGIGFGGFCGGFTAGVGANASWDGSGSYGVSASVGYGAPGQAGFGLSVGEQHTNAGGWTTNVGAGLTLGNGSFSGSVGASATFGSDGFEGYGINAGITGTNTKGDFAGASISSNFDKNGNFESTGFGLTYGDTNKKGDSLSMTETMTVDKDNKVSLSNSYSASLDLRQNAIYNGNKNFGGTGSTEYYNKDTLAAMQNTNKDNFDNQHALYQQSMAEQQMMSTQPAIVNNANAAASEVDPDDFAGYGINRGGKITYTPEFQKVRYAALASRNVNDSANGKGNASSLDDSGLNKLTPDMLSKSNPDLVKNLAEKGFLFDDKSGNFRSSTGVEFRNLPGVMMEKSTLRLSVMERMMRWV